MAPVRTTRRVPLLAIITLCTLWGLWSAQQSVLLTIVSGRTVDSWLQPLGLQMSTAAFWALLTPLIMITTRVIRDRVLRRSLWIATHIGFFLIVHVIDSAAYSLLTQLFSPNPRPFVQLVFSLTTFNMVTYGMIAVVTTALDYQDALRERGLREARLEAQLASAQFQALRAQLHPHFLFNALNAISALIHKDANRAERMLARLSELLRLAIDSATTPEVRLADEVEFVKRYLEIERMRFGDRLAVNLAIAPDTHDALVPNMLLQPLVENAVRHGVAPIARPGRVELRAERSGSSLDIVVSDSGRGIDSAPPNGGKRDGVGLRATRERLAQLYGSAHMLTLNNVPGGFEARVSLPFRRGSEGAREP
ncbi:MAG TPA: histidine kinase [Gemmatimonadaceae bacterium]|nr:histidine kinase [Gemmatimonadaceae bacterium]